MYTTTDTTRTDERDSVTRHCAFARRWRNDATRKQENKFMKTGFFTS